MSDLQAPLLRQADARSQSGAMTHRGYLIEALVISESGQRSAGHLHAPAIARVISGGRQHRGEPAGLQISLRYSRAQLQWQLTIEGLVHVKHEVQSVAATNFGPGRPEQTA